MVSQVQALNVLQKAIDYCESNMVGWEKKEYVLDEMVRFRKDELVGEDTTKFIDVLVGFDIAGTKVYYRIIYYGGFSNEENKYMYKESFNNMVVVKSGGTFMSRFVRIVKDMESAFDSM